MRSLGIGTSRSACDLALVEGDGPVANHSEPMTRGQEAHLPGLLRALLGEAEWRLDEIERIAVVTGPGSFTGVRIGVSFARGLALALRVPALGITSLEACLDPDRTGPALVALEARKRPPDLSFWVQGFDLDGAAAEPRECPLQEIEALRQGAASVFTDRPDRLAGATSARPCPVIAARRAARMAPGAGHPVPCYVRAPDAVRPAGLA